MSVSVVKAFCETALHAIRLSGKTEAGRLQVKQSWGNQVLSTLGFSLKVVGEPPPPGSGILVGNHVSYLDIPVLLAVVPESVFLAKSDMQHWPIIGNAATKAGTIFVDRRRLTGGRQVLRTMENGLQDGQSKLVVFPSGTTRLEETHPWKKGIFKFAQTTGTPLHLFRIDYRPLRESAYVDNDNLLLQMRKVATLSPKTVTVTWFHCQTQVSDPGKTAEEYRQLCLGAAVL